ncbi:9367_t:CDS:2, partial [Funneliformis geosporum]
IHNPNGVKSSRIKEALINQYMTTFDVSYNTRKSIWNKLPDISTFGEADLIENLTIYSYDAEKHIRSFDNTKLIDFIPTNLKNSEDYLKALGKFVELPKIQSYLKNYIIPIPADFPGQLYISRAIVNKMKLGIQSQISDYILHIVPILGPLHVSLNTRET